MNLGDVVNFKCVDGMKFEGESLSTTCQVIKKAYLYNKSGASFLNVFVEYIYSNLSKGVLPEILSKGPYAVVELA